MTEDIGYKFTDFLRLQMFEKITRISPITINEFNLGDLVDRFTRSFEDAKYFGEYGVWWSYAYRYLGCYASFKLEINGNFINCDIGFDYCFKDSAGKTPARIEAANSTINQSGYLLYQVISWMKTVQVYGQEQRERDYLNQWIKDHRKSRHHIGAIWCLNLSSRFEQSLCVGLVLTFVAWQVFNDQLSIGSLVMFNVYTSQLYTNMQIF
ncbi:ABC transporter transmembrane domain-containing protein [Sporomusa ovata]|uniref:ABC transmembrane type-1 domain-containing protein n=1 Tax=Sporomusa ovata TaxID=2378 RepID=A0A0U1KS58_9FIRM|nr:ABC transporter transmembrane domain-containing protein [Sporomusa ovata]CQR70270.1 hypothetical protein SpAn4DRAFT_1239 [Sporomusa ovata]